jgi:hypothetical protein
METDPADDTTRDQVKGLARPHRSGGWVVERAPLAAVGHDLDAAVSWIEAHGGVAELPVSRSSQGGLHSPRSAVAESTVPLRFVLPADALS